MTKVIIGMVTLLCAQVALATTKTVSTVAALQSAINFSAAGDTIKLANGTYLNSTLSISKSNIKVMAATTGGVYLNGTNAITIAGSSDIFSGFQFTSGKITGSAITVNGSSNTLSQLNFNGYSAAHMIIIYGQHNTVTNSNFQNKPAPSLVNHGGTGDMVQIIPSSTIPGYNTIRYCSFQHMPGFGGDYGNECIRIGDGAYSTYVSRTVVEFCYFEDTGNGDSEAISVKSRENCLRFNTMNNNPNAMFSFRNGDNNVAYSNFFIRSGGIRCKQSNNIYCYNNYFQQSGTNQNTSLPGNGTAPVYLEYFGTGYGSNFNFVHNTFYRCSHTQIDTKLQRCTWANNIFYSDSATIFTGTTSGQSFAGNIYFGSLGLSIPTGMKNINPLLTLNANGYFGLSATSPAINASSTAFPAILDIAVVNDDPLLLQDISGQARPSSESLKDVGCDEYTTGTIVIRPLKLTDVGTSYVHARTATPPLNVTTKANFSISPNPSNDYIYISGDKIVEKATVQIYSISGIMIKTIKNYTTGQEIAIGDLSTGMYDVKVISPKNGLLTSKLISKM